MKYLKKYEGYKEPSENDPKVGEYVICNDDPDEDKDLLFFLANNIGIIINDVSSDMSSFRTYIVKYDKIPTKLIPRFRGFHNNVRTIWERNILYHSNNKKELEIIITANKYNI